MRPRRSPGSSGLRAPLTFFLYDAAGRLAYRVRDGRLTPGNGVAVTGALLDDAIMRVLAGEPVPEPHPPSLGCSIK